MNDELEQYPKRKWVAYRHIDGKIHVKRYDSKLGQELLDEMYESRFVESVTGVYEAENRAEAEKIAIKKLGYVVG